MNEWLMYHESECTAVLVTHAIFKEMAPAFSKATKIGNAIDAVNLLLGHIHSHIEVIDNSLLKLKSSTKEVAFLHGMAKAFV